MYETQKTEIKREMHTEGTYQLSNDSLTGEELNPEFQALDRGLMGKIIQRQQTENNMINQLMAGNKISMGY